MTDYLMQNIHNPIKNRVSIIVSKVHWDASCYLDPPGRVSGLASVFYRGGDQGLQMKDDGQ